MIGYALDLVCYILLSDAMTSKYQILFSQLCTAARALDVLNFTPVNRKTIRVMYSERDPSSRKNVAANVFIKVLLDQISHDNYLISFLALTMFAMASFDFLISLAVMRNIHSSA